MPSVVEDAIAHGVANPGNTPGTTTHYSETNNLYVVLNEPGTVVTVSWGRPT